MANLNGGKAEELKEKKEKAQLGEPLIQSESQAKLTGDIKISIMKKSKNNFFVVKSAPGSGKTTTIIESVKGILAQIESSDKEKILILVFNTKMKEEIDEKVKKAGLDTDKLEIRTINSLFFQHTWRFESKDGNSKGTFSLDYTRSFFTKKMIKEVASSLMPTSEGYGESPENALQSSRIFSADTLSDKNIDILYRYVNAYFSSPYAVSDFKAFDKISLFFAKNDTRVLSLKDITLSEFDKAIIQEKFHSIAAKGVSNEEIYFTLVVRQIDVLAKIKNVLPGEVIRGKESIVQVDFKDANGNLVGSKEHAFRTEKRKYTYEHIFKVPHNYYYKEFMKKVFSDEAFKLDVFSKYRAIYVDEAQDNDLIFFKIMIDVLKAGIVDNVIAVGDPHQAIYSFKSPDHFDILEFATTKRDFLEKEGITVQEYSLGQTYRFGQDVARLVNATFPDANIIGKPAMDSAVLDEPLNIAMLSTVLNNISTMKNVKAAIICRTNNEAIKLMIGLRRMECTAAKLHTNIKSDFKSFFSDGIKAIDDERVRNEIIEAVSLTGRNKTFLSYDDIMHSDEAKKILNKNGYSQFTQFNKTEIESYILDTDRKRKNIIITTAHQSKGAEYNYVIIAGDFFRRELSAAFPRSSVSEDTFYENDNVKSSAGALAAIGALISAHKSPNVGVVPSVSIDVTSKDVAIEQSKVIELLNSPTQREERNALYVAMTRCKTGLMFLESPLSDVMISIIKDSKSNIRANAVLGSLLVDFESCTTAKANTEDKVFKEDTEPNPEPDEQIKSLFS